MGCLRARAFRRAENWETKDETQRIAHTFLKHLHKAKNDPPGRVVVAVLDQRRPRVRISLSVVVELTETKRQVVWLPVPLEYREPQQIVALTPGRQPPASDSLSAGLNLIEMMRSRDSVNRVAAGLDGACSSVHSPLLAVQPLDAYSPKRFEGRAERDGGFGWLVALFASSLVKRNVRMERAMRIRELMNRPVVTCRPSDMLSVAAQAMWEHDCGSIPVVGDDGRLVGIITDRDICMATYTKSRAPQTVLVADVMAKRVTSCHADESAEVAEDKMRDRQVRRVPIVDDDNKPIGILSQSDLARKAAADPRRHTVEKDFIHTMAAISQPRSRAIEKSSVASSRTRVT